MLSIDQINENTTPHQIEQILRHSEKTISDYSNGTATDSELLHSVSRLAKVSFANFNNKLVIPRPLVKRFTECFNQLLKGMSAQAIQAASGKTLEQNYQEMDAAQPGWRQATKLRMVAQDLMDAMPKSVKAAIANQAGDTIASVLVRHIRACDWGKACTTAKELMDMEPTACESLINHIITYMERLDARNPGLIANPDTLLSLVDRYNAVMTMVAADYIKFVADKPNGNSNTQTTSPSPRAVQQPERRQAQGQNMDRRATASRGSLV